MPHGLSLRPALKLAALGVVAHAAPAVAQVWHCGLPYRSWTDSPFATTDFTKGYFYLEDFELGTVVVPGLRIPCGHPAGYSSMLPASESVDEDDGMLDGRGTAACWRTNHECSSVTFYFDRDSLGGVLPTHAGVVWTDVASSSLGYGYGLVFLEAFDSEWRSAGVCGPIVVGDGASDGSTADDRFMGIELAGGIAAFTIRMPCSNEFSIDHVQFGLPVLCRPDYNADGFLTGDDYDAYVAAFEAGDDSADFNRDGFVTGDDFDAYALAFETGC